MTVSAFFIALFPNQLKRNDGTPHIPKQSANLEAVPKFSGVIIA